MYEFIHALVRISWVCYPSSFGGNATRPIGRRLSILLHDVVLPGSVHVTSTDEAFEKSLRFDRRLLAITAHYEVRIRPTPSPSYMLTLS